MCKSKGGSDWELISYSQEMYLLGIVVPWQKILHGKQQAANVGLILIMTTYEAHMIKQGQEG